MRDLIVGVFGHVDHPEGADRCLTFVIIINDSVMVGKVYKEARLVRGRVARGCYAL